MAIEWRLKNFLANNYGIYKGTELRKLISGKTGVIISLPNLYRYLNQKPKILPLATIEILCTALDCEMSAFCKVSPSKRKRKKVEKLSFKNTPKSKRLAKNFPDPSDYVGYE